MSKGVERIVIEMLAEGLTRDRRRLKAPVETGHGAAGKRASTSVALASEAHMLPARRAGNGSLHRCVDEPVPRCPLVLAAYERPRSSDCAASGQHPAARLRPSAGGKFSGDVVPKGEARAEAAR